MIIPFTQYLQPHGERIQVTIDMPDDIGNKAQSLIDKNCHFDIEILATDKISMTCELGQEDDPKILAIEIYDNGPEVPIAVSMLINRAYEKLFSQGVTNDDQGSV